ncbi:SRPBCC domain-containing protein [Vibrio sp. E150_011]
MSDVHRIQWPDYFHPKNAQIHVQNDIIIPAECGKIWQCIVRAPCWPHWPHRRTAIQIIRGNSQELQKGTVFNWVTKTKQFNCTVVEYTPFERIAWRGKTGDVDMYHAWLLSPCSKGCRVLTESTQRGGMTWLTKRFVSKQVNAYHQHWLETLNKQLND